MSDGAKSTAYFLGVDGGGTGCRARIEDAAGTILGVTTIESVAMTQLPGGAFAHSRYWKL